MSGTALASRLEGKTIEEWRVIKKRIKTEEDHSGAFSSCYEVQNIENNRYGFLKALNYNYAFKELKPGISSTEIIHELTANYNYEKDLLTLCTNKHMSRVVTAIAYGEYREPEEMLPVPYLVFEVADGGSLKNISAKKSLDLSWKLGSIHGFLVGLSQLHQEKIAHQDIKPSNILIFGHNVSKLADLGNATKFDRKSPMWDKDLHCGDWTYAPIELWYGYCSPNWETRRLGADFFMAGGIITFRNYLLNKPVTLEFDFDIDSLFNILEGFFCESFSDTHGLFLDVVLGDCIITTGADGTQKIIQRLNFDTHLESFLTTPRANKFNSTHLSSYKRGMIKLTRFYNLIRRYCKKYHRKHTI